MRKGRLSKEEVAYIEANVHNTDIGAIAAYLDRDPISIHNFVKKKLRYGVSSEEAASFDLEDRPYWGELRQQFSIEELEIFKWHWARTIDQFKENIMSTEEMQVVDMIKLELLMNRCLKLNKSSTDQILAFEALIQQERSLDAGLQNREDLFNLERQVASLKSSQESLTRDYRELQTKKNAMLKEMRATREQRVKDIEESKQSFVGWMTHLITHPEVCREYGITMEKMRLAMEAEKKRLSAYHTYEDGQIDQPFLTPETVLE